jgi:hypothetical protein
VADIALLLQPAWGEARAHGADECSLQAAVTNPLLHLIVLANIGETAEKFNGRFP